MRVTSTPSMDEQKNKKATQRSEAESKVKVAKEIKGAVDEETSNKKTGNEEKHGEPKGLPHQEVPQPGDFNTEALEQL